MRLRSPLAPWFDTPRALADFRRRALGRRAVVRHARDHGWRAIAPDFEGALALVRAGVPFQTALDRRYDRSARPSALTAALRAGATIYLPQVHQVLPRVMRLIVALRVAFFGAFRDECSFLFLVEGRGRQGLGLHHDGAVDAFWLQLEGHRAVTLGPPVAPGSRQDLRRRPPRGTPGWRTLELPPGSLLHLPPRTPHEVVCHARSLALSLTWSRPRPRRADARRSAMALAAWDVASGRAHPRPARARGRLWTQVPAVAGAGDDGAFPLWTVDGELRLPLHARPLASRLSAMPVIEDAPAAAAVLAAHGVLAPEDLPLTIIPDAPRDLDGWRFA